MNIESDLLVSSSTETRLSPCSGAPGRASPSHLFPAIVGPRFCSLAGCPSRDALLQDADPLLLPSHAAKLTL